MAAVVLVARAVVVCDGGEDGDGEQEQQWYDVRSCHRTCNYKRHNAAYHVASCDTFANCAGLSLLPGVNQRKPCAEPAAR